MDFSKSVYEIIKWDLSELREQAKSMTIKELAEANGTSYSKMSMILRFIKVKAKKPIIQRKRLTKAVKTEKPKKDHTVSSWASSFNHGRIRYVYYDMIRRCHKETDNNYKNYGGRGITVCESWREDCCNFYKWAKESGYKEGTQIDRIDNNKGYCPENCRWVTPRENAMNRRCTRRVTFKEQTHTLDEWADITGISYQVLADRIYRYGWTIERALTTDTMHDWAKSSKK